MNQDLLSLAVSGQEVESADFIKVYTELSNETVPNLDFSDPSTFAHYGMASRYYEDAFNVIRELYPYDGSFAEKLKWYKNLPWIDRYFFDHIYPRKVGHAIFSAQGWGSPAGPLIDGIGLSDTPEYIRFYGGPHAQETFNKSNVLDAAHNRGSNLSLGLGNTVEFCLQKAAQEPNTAEEVILDVWNQRPVGDPYHSRLLITISTTPIDFDFNIEYYANGNGYTIASLTGGISYSSKPSAWAITFDAFGNVTVFQNGLPFATAVAILGGPMTLCERDLMGCIGQYQAACHSHAVAAGYGKLSAAIDEFRFWKVVRTEKQIYRFHNMSTGGGTNTDDANTDLGVYFKFNEGITGEASFDRNVIDYSGRISNGFWVGYTANSRSEESAWELAGLTTAEYREPILYEGHPELEATVAEYLAIANTYDLNNRQSIYRSMPTWMQDEDALGENQLQLLAQIMGTMFDTIALQIQYMMSYRSADYEDVLTGNYPLAARLLQDVGIPANEVLALTTMIEEYFRRAEDVRFEADLYKIRNLIYTHIFNNISKILRGKGTLASVRNLMRCFGVDSDVLQLKTYVDGDRQFLSDLRTAIVERKKRFLSFAAVDNHSATLYGYTAGLDPEETAFIPDIGASDNAQRVPFTVECDVVFPLIDHDLGFTKSSIFGMHQDDGAGNWAVPDFAAFQVYSERHPTREGFTRFTLEAAGLGISALETDYYEDIYADTYWLFAVRLLRHQELPGEAHDTGYDIEFVGFNISSGYLKQQFALSAAVAAVPGIAFLRRPKRLYAGAHRTNWTGAVVNYSDVKIGNLRAYFDYVPDEVLQIHAKDPQNFGTFNPNRPGWMGQFWDYAFPYLPQMESMVLNWGFTAQTQESEPMAIFDEYHGPIRDNVYQGIFYDVVKYKYPARAFGFVNLTEPGLLLQDHFFSAEAKQLPFDSPLGSDIELVRDYETELFYRNNIPSRVVHVLEKSASAAVSSAMQRFFGDLAQYGDLFGQGVDRYRMVYKRLDALRRKFFNKTNNVMDMERFLSYYRWINYAIGQLVSTLLPAQDHFMGQYDVVESHMLERNKYQHKFPLVKDAPDAMLEACVMGGMEMRYSVEAGSAFMDFTDPDVTRKHWDWWKRRADRSLPQITSGDPVIDAARNAIRDAVELYSYPKEEVGYEPRTATIYARRVFAFRSLGGLAGVQAELRPGIHVGINYQGGFRPGFSNAGTVGDETFEVMTSELPVNKHSLDRIAPTTIVYANTVDATGEEMSSARRLPGTLVRDNVTGDVTLTNVQSNAYLPNGETCIQNVACAFGGKAYRRQNAFFGAHNIEEFEISYNTITGNWEVDKELTPSKKRFSTRMIEDVERPVTISNIRRG